MDIYSKAYNLAVSAASKAKPGFCTVDGKLYTFDFCQNEWVYNVYENGFLFIRFNVKTLKAAKKALKFHLEN